MKLVQSLVVAAALAIPAVSSFAQTSQAAPADNQIVQANNAAADAGGVTDGTSASGARHELRSFRNAVSHVGHKIEGSIRPDANDGMKPVYFGS